MCNSCQRSGDAIDIFAAGKEDVPCQPRGRSEPHRAKIKVKCLQINQEFGDSFSLDLLVKAASPDGTYALQLSPADSALSSETVTGVNAVGQVERRQDTVLEVSGEQPFGLRAVVTKDFGSRVGSHQQVRHNPLHKYGTKVLSDYRHQSQPWTRTSNSRHFTC